MSLLLLFRPRASVVASISAVGGSFLPARDYHQHPHQKPERKREPVPIPVPVLSDDEALVLIAFLAELE